MCGFSFNYLPIPDRTATAVQPSRADHTHIAHGISWEKNPTMSSVAHITFVGVPKRDKGCVFQGVLPTNLADELPELVQVTLSLWSDAQLPDSTVELLRSLKWILEWTQEADVLSESSEVEVPKFQKCAAPSFSNLLIRLVFCLPEEADVLDEPRLDVFVVHELAEDVKLLPQELVGEIHLPCQRRKDIPNTHKKASDAERKHKSPRQVHCPPTLTHRGVHDSGAVCPDGVGNVSDVDGV